MLVFMMSPPHYYNYYIVNFCFHAIASQITGGAVVFRTPSTTSRESYAAPNFQRQPTILIRAESQRRKNEIEQTVQ